MHGYTIAARIEQVSSGAIQLNMGTLYPGLLRLQSDAQIQLISGHASKKRPGGVPAPVSGSSGRRVPRGSQGSGYLTRVASSAEGVTHWEVSSRVGLRVRYFTMIPLQATPGSIDTGVLLL
jgi:hypothetical protein